MIFAKVETAGSGAAVANDRRSAGEDARRAAAVVWRFRAKAELEAAARFRWLAGELAAVGAVQPVIAMAAEAADDELRHAAQCVELVHALGGEEFEGDAKLAVPSGFRAAAPAGLGRRERLLYEVIAMACITETLSAALLGEMVERAADEGVGKAMQAILRDEVNHARLGWAHLAAESQRDPASVLFLGDYLPAMLAGTVQDELFGTSAEHGASEALNGLGALDRSSRRRIFEGSLRLVVFPGLKRFGVDITAGERWLEERGRSIG